MNYSDNVSYLDKIRLNKGPEKLNEVFNDIYKSNPINALQLLNSPNLSFPCLFLLSRQINELNIKNKLNIKNNYALKFCENDKPNFKSQIAPISLKWIFTTGSKEDSLNDEFDEIVDNSAAHLIIFYKDKSILPMLTELIFNRNRKGKYIHDLVWCLFKSKDSKVMPLVAKYIASNDEYDRNLACKLLNFKPQLQPDDKNQQYNNFNKWLNDNKNYLYFTDDSLQQTSSPKYWRVNLTAKYLCNNSDSFSLPASTFSNEQQTRIKEFNELSYIDQKLLAKYSHKTHKKNINAWKAFMKSPITLQLYKARAELGGEQ